MRRPVKPFVTEYKGPNRRPPQQANAAAPRRSSEDMAFSSPHDIFSRNGSDHAVFTQSPPQSASHFHGHHAEDSYEAAMRAADALFAPASRPVNTTETLSTAPVTVRDTQPDLDALFATPSAGMSDGAADASQPGRGRILRVLDEDPEPELIALEAERAPKRRGRKPGSKNKPKEGFVAPQRRLAANEPAHFIFNHPAAPMIASIDSQPTPEILPPARQAASEIMPSRRKSSLQKGPATPIAAAKEAAPGVPVNGASVAGDDNVRNEPFSWVRVKLAPGERWKRRLPKVCW